MSRLSSIPVPASDRPRAPRFTRTPRWIASRALAALVALATAAFAPAGVQPALGAPAGSADVATAGSGAGPGEDRIAFIADTPKPYGAMIEKVRAMGGTILAEYENLDAFAFEVPARKAGEAALLFPSLHRDRMIPAPASQKVRIGEKTLDYPMALVDEAGLPLRMVPIPAERFGDYSPDMLLGYDMMIGATSVWPEADFGSDAIVAIIDTGTYTGHPALAGNVIGGKTFVPGDPEDGWGLISNGYHGTFVGGMVAGHAVLLMDETIKLARSVQVYSPESLVPGPEPGTVGLVLFGTAPGAKIYAEKVFPPNDGAPASRIVEAVDHAVSLRKSGELHIDVINMSLGGPVLYDADDPIALAVDAATKAGITVVTAAGNNGPAPISVASPGCAKTSITVGAGVDPIHTNIVIDVFLLNDAFPAGGASILWPHQARQVSFFSSRGATADNRTKPDLIATGQLNIGSALFDNDADGVNDAVGYSVGSGTSFATPTVAGAAALLASWSKRVRGEADPLAIRNALVEGAVPIPNGYSETDQGAGYLNVEYAFDILSGRKGHPRQGTGHAAKVLTADLSSGSWRGSFRGLVPGRTASVFVPVDETIGALTVAVRNVVLSDPGNFVLDDDVRLYVHSPKRGGTSDYFLGGELVKHDVAYEIPVRERGTMRVTVEGDFTNLGPADFDVELTAHPKEPEERHGRRSHLAEGESEMHFFDVPPGTAELTAILDFRRDWSVYPTTDMDFILFHHDAEGNVDFTSFQGAQINAPERARIVNPLPGRWSALVIASSVLHGQEVFSPLEIFLDGLPANELYADGRGADGRGTDGDDGAPGGDAAVALAGTRARITAVPAGPGAGSGGFTVHAPRPGRASLALFDLSGRMIRRIVDRDLGAGDHTFEWDGRSESGATVASGIYFARFLHAGEVDVRKVVVRR